MMQHQKLKWALIVFLVPSLILGLTACSSQSESEAPPAVTAKEKAAEGAEAEVPAPTEEAPVVTELAAEESEAEVPAPTKATMATAEIAALSTPETSGQVEKVEETPTETGRDTTLDSRHDVSVFTINDWPIPPEAEEVEFIMGGGIDLHCSLGHGDGGQFLSPHF